MIKVIKFVAIAGIDGAGKATQTELLRDRLVVCGHKVEKVAFPQYEKKSAGLVEEYLSGTYGTALEVGPKRASIFYACDRYDGSFWIRKLLSQEIFVVADRYLDSIGHQGGKIADREQRSEFFKWLHELEYELFEIPKPAITFILQTSSQFATELSGKVKDPEKLAKKKSFLGDRIQDIHEVDIQHLQEALGAFLQAAEEFPDQYTIIECLDEDGSLFPPEVIHNRIWEKVVSIFEIA